MANVSGHAHTRAAIFKTRISDDDTDFRMAQKLPDRGVFVSRSQYDTTGLAQDSGHHHKSFRIILDE